jgi:type II secretory pathway component PulF
MQRRTREEVRNALLYPAFLMVTAIAGITTLLTVVVPNLENLFGSRSRDTLPAATRIVIATSHLLRDNGLVLALGLIVLMMALVAVAGSPVGKTFVNRLLLKTPIFGSLLQIIETGRFTRSLSALLAGSVAVARAMPLAVRTVSNGAMRHALQTAHERIMTGAPVGEAIAASGVLPADAIGLIRMGERTGRLDAALERIASLYEGRAARKLKALTTVLTPVLTIGFGLVAGVIIYAMLSTILSINDLARP